MRKAMAIGRAVALATGMLGMLDGLARARAQAPPTSARVDTQPLELSPVEQYRIPAILEPVRRVTLIAAADGVIRSQDAKAGTDVRVGQEVAKLDAAESFARLRIAQAEAKEMQANVELARETPSRAAVAVAEARLDVAKARVELAQAELERCALRAPFAGRVLASPVSDGQFVTKGTVIAELADVSSVKALIPLARGSASLGGSVAVVVEGQAVSGKVQAFLPLPPEFSALRELATPLTAAWVVLPNNGALEPGQRVWSPALPSGPVANIPAEAVRADETKASGGMVQVLRNEYVTNVPVRVLGTPAPDRLQISGPLRPTDALIVATSVPLLPGTFVRFNAGAGGGAVEGTTPSPSLAGEPARLAQPAAANTPQGGRGPDPIGAPGSAAPRRPNPPAPGTQPPGRPAGNTVPF